MTEHIKYLIDPEVRPMGPLLEGDQAVIDAIEQIPPGHHNAYRDGDRLVSISRVQRPGIRDELTIFTGSALDLKDRDPKDRAYAHVVHRGISTDYAGVKTYGSHKVRHDHDRVSDGVIITHPIRQASSKEVQAHKLNAARAIIDLAQKMEDAAEAIDIKQERKKRTRAPLGVKL